MRRSVLLYDRDVGQAGVIGFDATGKLIRDVTDADGVPRGTRSFPAISSETEANRPCSTIATQARPTWWDSTPPAR
jgi:hypothetical protein